MSGLEIYPLAAAGQHPNVNITLMFIHFLIQKKLVQVDTDVMRSICGLGSGNGGEVGRGCSMEENLKKELQEASEKLQEKDALLQEIMKQKNNSDIKNNIQDQEIKQLKATLKQYENKYEKYSLCDFPDYLSSQEVQEINGKYVVELSRGFQAYTKVVIVGTAGVNNARMFFSLKNENATAFQLDNRWQYYDSVNETIMNSKRENWECEIKTKPAAIEPGEDFTVSIEGRREEFQICINGWPFATYKHRVSPDVIRELVVSGAEKMTAVYYFWYPIPIPDFSNVINNYDIDDYD